MKNNWSAAPSPALFKLTPIALCAALALSACGGGGGSSGGGVGVPGTKVAGNESPSAAPEPAAEGAAETGERKRVVTPADIARQRELERDHPAPVDRGVPGAKPGAAARQAGSENTVGQWSAPMSWPLNAIHAVLTPDGKVLSYGTDPSGTQGAQLYYDVSVGKKDLAVVASTWLKSVNLIPA